MSHVTRRWVMSHVDESCHTYDSHVQNRWNGMLRDFFPSLFHSLCLSVSPLFSLSLSLPLSHTRSLSFSISLSIFLFSLSLSLSPSLSLSRSFTRSRARFFSNQSLYLPMMKRWKPAGVRASNGCSSRYLRRSSPFSAKACVYVCMDGYKHICLHVCKYVSMWICMYVCLHVCVCICMCVCMYARVYVCMHVCFYVCMYVYMYVRTCVHMSVCICVCMQVSRYLRRPSPFSANA